MAYGRKENKDVCYFLFMAHGKIIARKCIAALNVSWPLPQKIMVYCVGRPVRLLAQVVDFFGGPSGKWVHRAVKLKMFSCESSLF